MLLDPGMDLTLRPMKYPAFYDMYRDAIKNTWTVEEVDFSTDVNDLRNKMGPAECLLQPHWLHLVIQQRQDLGDYHNLQKASSTRPPWESA